MADTKTPIEDEVLRRMLNTPPKPHKPLGKSGRAEARPSRSRKKPEDQPS